MTKGAPDPPAPTPPAREQADPGPPEGRRPSPDREQADSGPPVQDPRLLDAARRVLRDAGWEGLTIEAVAEAAGLSRVTAWRLGATREALVAALLRQLHSDYRDAMWPALVGPGSARERMEVALAALFSVADAHLPLLLASDQVFHRVGAVRIAFSEPFRRLFEDGAVDGSLAVPGGDPREAASVLFNTVCWSYVHLRGRHEWPPERVQQGMLALIAPGLDPPPGG